MMIVRDGVVNSSTINQFKNKLDRHLSKRQIMYDYKAELAGIFFSCIIYIWLP